MKRIAGIVAASFFIVCSGQMVQAQSLDQKMAAEKYDPQIKDAEKTLNGSCSSHIVVTLKWDGFDVSKLSNNNPASWCKQALDTLGAECQSSTAFKTAVANKIKGFNCVSGGAGAALFSLNANGDLNYAIDWSAANIGDQLLVYLKKQL